MKLNGLVVLSLSIILLTSVYAWVNRHHYYEFPTGNGYKLIIRENIYTMEKCTVRIGFGIKNLEDDNLPKRDRSLLEQSVIPEYCNDTPKN